jgi:hypothetical protein
MQKKIRIGVITDFLSGTGLFKNDRQAAELARRMSINQRQRLERYGIVPRNFFEYLTRIGVIRKSDIPSRRLTLGNFLDFLRLYRYPNELAQSYGQTLFRKIIHDELPWLRISFGQGDFVWGKMQEVRNFRCGKRGDRATIK